MAHGFKAELIRACRRLLRPLVRTLLRHGVAYDEFAEVARSVYVNIAREDFSLPGKKATDSRVAILTGLTRKEVKLQRESADAPGEERAGQVNRATRVLSGWHQDADFCGANGQPLVLPLEGKGKNFTELVRRYSGDMPPRAMLEELLRVNAVALVDDVRVRVLSRSYLTAMGDPEGARMLGYAVRDLASTIDYNLARNPAEPARFQRSAFAIGVDEKALADFQRLVGERGQRFLEEMDDWLSAHERKDKTNTRRAGAGIYYFEEESPKDKT